MELMQIPKEIINIIILEALLMNLSCTHDMTAYFFGTTKLAYSAMCTWLQKLTLQPKRKDISWQDWTP